MTEIKKRILTYYSNKELRILKDRVLARKIDKKIIASFLETGEFFFSPQYIIKTSKNLRLILINMLPDSIIKQMVDKLIDSALQFDNTKKARRKAFLEKYDFIKPMTELQKEEIKFKKALSKKQHYERGPRIKHAKPGDWLWIPRQREKIVSILPKYKEMADKKAEELRIGREKWRKNREEKRGKKKGWCW